ncbi:MAG: DUF3617 family protein, partial [Acidimicrobiales bacterium]
MKINAISLIGLACAMSSPAIAGDTFSITPGKWKSEVTMQMNMVAHGMTMNQPARTTSHEYCMTPEQANMSAKDFAKQINDSSDMGDMQCDVVDVDADPPRLSYALTCTQDGMEMTMENEFTMSADGKSGTGDGTITFEGSGMKMNGTTKTVQT